MYFGNNFKYRVFQKYVLLLKDYRPIEYPLVSKAINKVSYGCVPKNLRLRETGLKVKITLFYNRNDTFF